MTVFGDRVALYLVGLTEQDGFALALAVHERIPGPDPAILRERAVGRRIRRPMMIGAAPVETLASAAEGLPGGQKAARLDIGGLIREVHRAGEVPVLVMTDGEAIVSTIASIEAREGSSGATGHVGGREQPAVQEPDDVEIQGWTVSVGGDA